MENNEVSILIVEDSPDVQLLLKITFQGSSYKLTNVSSVEEARTILKKRSFDIILLDIGLPEDDGLVLCSELQDDDRLGHAHIIVLSGDAEVSQKVVAFSMGADDYVVKPFSPLELRARIAARLMKKQHQSLQAAPKLKKTGT